MKRFNPQLLERLFALCEERGSTELITHEHYEMFLTLDDNTVRIISKLFIEGTAVVINQNLENGIFKTDHDLIRHVRDWWEMMIQGFVVLHEKTGKICFRKPRGVAVDPAMETKLDKWLDGLGPVILKAFSEVLDNGKQG